METVPGVAAKGEGAAAEAQPGHDAPARQGELPLPLLAQPRACGCQTEREKIIPSTWGKSSSEKEPKHGRKASLDQPLVCSGVGEWEMSPRFALSDGGRSEGSSQENTLGRALGEGLVSPWDVGIMAGGG